uniref:tetratricopeptide repeat protein n=1 Tax=Fulvivirga sp. TaxID=1931237 RepID=UPI00404B3283
MRKVVGSYLIFGVLIVFLNYNAQCQYLLKNTESEKLLQSAEMAYNASNLALADSLVSECIIYDQKNASAYFLRAKIRESQGHLLPALVDYEAVILLDPLHQEARFKKALLLYQLKNYHAAIEDINLLLQNDSHYATTTVFFEVNDANELQGMKTIHTMQSDLYNLRGLSYHGLSQYQKALHDFDIASSIAKNNPDYYVNAAQTHLALFDTTMAINHLKKALTLQPNSEIARYNLKILGIEVPEVSLSEHENQTNFLPGILQLAFDNFAKRNYQLAYQYYKKALNIAPQNAEIWMDLGRTEYHLGSIKASINSHRRSLSIDEKLHKNYYLLGNSYYKLQEYSLASDAYQLYLMQEPKDEIAAFNYGLVLIKLNQIGAACEQLNYAKNSGLSQAITIFNKYCQDN